MDMKTPSSSKPSRNPKGRPAEPFVVISTTPNGGKKKRTSYRLPEIGKMLEQLEFYAHAEPLNETELLLRFGDNELTLRVV